jgi:uncharacterized membrane-anchored protein
MKKEKKDLITYRDIIIHKPIYGTYCSIDKRKLIQAKREGKMIRVIIENVCEAILDPQWWWDTGKKEKRVVRYAGSPMTFVYNTVPQEKILEQKKHISIDQLSLC